MTNLDKIVEELNKKVKEADNEVHAAVMRYNFAKAAEWEKIKASYENSLEIVKKYRNWHEN